MLEHAESTETPSSCGNSFCVRLPTSRIHGLEQLSFSSRPILADRFAAAAGLGTAQTRARISTLASRLLEEIPGIERPHPVSESVASLITERCKDYEFRFRSGLSERHPQVLELVVERISGSGDRKYPPFPRRWKDKASRHIEPADQEGD